MFESLYSDQYRPGTLGSPVFSWRQGWKLRRYISIYRDSRAFQPGLQFRYRPDDIAFAAGHTDQSNANCTSAGTAIPWLSNVFHLVKPDRSQLSHKVGHPPIK